MCFTVMCHVAVHAAAACPNLTNLRYAIRGMTHGEGCRPRDLQPQRGEYLPYNIRWLSECAENR